MLEVSWNEQSLNSFYKKMDNIIRNLGVNTKSGIEEATENTRKDALERKKGNKDDKLIQKEFKHFNEYMGRVFTNFKYAPFLEYGTGRYAEMPHIGKSKTFFESGFKFWYAPATSVNKNYSMTDFMVVDGVFYPMITQMHGKTYVLVFEQKSRPFMRPSAFYMRPKNVETVKKVLQKGILTDIK